MKTSKSFFLSLAALLCATAAFAVPVTFTASATSGDGPVSASATLSLVSPTQLQLTLSNTLAANLFVSPGQSLSDFEFNLSGGTITSLGTATSSGTGTLINIGAGGSVTPTGSNNIPPFVPPNSGGWGLNTNVNAGGTTFGYQITALTGMQPDFMIAPNGNSFPNANGGLTGGQFNPFVQGTGTFLLNGTGFTGATTITSASFSFGTGPDFFTPGTPGIPDNGATVALLGLSLAGVELLRRSLSKRQPAKV